MADWLRPVFNRAKTPVQGSTPTFERQNQVSIDETLYENDEVAVPKLRPTSRVSSYMGFRPNTPPVANLDPFPNVRCPESLYHKPSGDQMAETLKVVMMSRYTIDPIPVEYNACILHVLEAYQDLREQVNANQDAIEEMKHSHTKDIKDFEALATQWEEKERDYKAEVKKLEVLLSKTEGGMESVMVARSKSQIHCTSRASDEIGRTLSTMKERHKERNTRRKKSHEEAEPQACPLPSIPMKFPSIHELGLSHTNIVALEKQQSEQSHDLPDFTSSSGLDNSTDSLSHKLLSQDDLVSIGIAVQEKPLPDIQARARKFPSKESKHLGLSSEGQLSFSFNPGDDESILKQDDNTSEIRRQILGDLIKHTRFATSDETFDTTKSPLPTDQLPTISTPDEPPRRRLRSTKASFNLQSSYPVSRGGSTGSVVTAIRLNSCRSSVGGFRNESRADSVAEIRSSRNSGGNEAVTAAAWAFTASDRASRNGTSSPGTTEDKIMSDDMRHVYNAAERKGQISSHGIVATSFPEAIYI
ncbi:hypothetical protein BJ875DRAFT_436677 [Amylocarpus encephaloides]|uniref:Uncharacterized protein n=1 Tax=Amylocarpus encephaloides TaxID=45428 RepID=A0A9P8C9W2_9HELO|nr:hypothetical protein BJ875DRAFT_436677 [Amylocarpus encephaloides]